MRSSLPGSSHASLRPVISSNAFASPLATLEESLSNPNTLIDLHDLTEAYNVLSMRMREIVSGVPASEQATAAALSSLTKESHILTNALRRDMERVKIHPCLSPEEGMNLGGIDDGYNFSYLGQQAMRITAGLFAFPRLHSTLSVEHLRLLLNDVLELLSLPSLPTPHPKKTFALLRWILENQALPVNVLSPYKTKILANVRQCLEQVEEGALIDGLKILAELLRRYSKLFIGPACDLFRKVLDSLVVKSHGVRAAAAHSLSAFAYAKVSMNLGYQQRVSTELSDALYNFATAHSGDFSEDLPLYNVLRSACEVSQLGYMGEGPQWASVVIASFIVLIDRPIFDSKSKLLDRLKALLWIIADSNSPTIQRLTAPVWACFVWAFARIPAGDSKSKGVQKWLSQDLRNGIGSTVCYVLLNVSSGDMTKRVLDVVQNMYGALQSRTDAVSVLCQLLGASDPSSNPSKDILYKQLFDGSILDVSQADLSNVIELRSGVVPELGRRETISYWDRLYSLWVEGVKFVITESVPNVPDSIFTAWQTLLLADSDLSESQGHLAPTPKVAGILGDLCQEFAFKTLDVEKEMSQIRLESRDNLLNAIVSRDFRISDVAVQRHWFSLCSTVNNYPPRDTDGLLVAQDLLDFDKPTWITVARQWVTIEGVVGDSLVTFLKLVEQLTGDEELELWRILFCQARAGSRTSSQATGAAALSLWKAFVPNDTKQVLDFPRQYHVLLSAFLDPTRTDDAQVISNDIYSQKIISLYKDILERLRPEPANERTLNSLRKLFLAPFDRHDAPGEAYDAFEAFWKVTYLNKPEFFYLYDSDLKRFLKGLDTATDGNLAAGLTQSDNSQQISSLVPETLQDPLYVTDSQALYHWADNAPQGEDQDEIVPQSSSPPPPEAFERLALAAIRHQSAQSHLEGAMYVDNQDKSTRSERAQSPGVKRKRHEEEEEIIEDSFVRASPPRSPQRNSDPEPARSSLHISTQRKAPELRRISEGRTKGKDRAPSHVSPTQTPRSSNRRTVAPSRSYRESQLMTPEPSAPPSSHFNEPLAVSVSPPQQEDRGEDDVDWERPVSPRSLAQISRELELAGTDPFDDLNPNALSKIFSTRPPKKQKPSPDASGTSALRRSSRNKPASSDKLLRLKQALQALKDDPEASEEDLVKASNLVKEFGTTVNKRLLGSGITKTRSGKRS
ncbi:hypothetical protein D9757_008462 [Collybiopsis confluens]|uniref:Telomere-associated protein Rif1 N-terminal domain-containing protein n=1 Tax=Collybiopsis confluens TaxID=2823264 RepID=A0A8H5HG28_9AGAR|nr:hypothetical protein D9757_008462 [Collybiopsis confluens]